MNSIGFIAFSEAYSIDLYAINLKKKNVPEKPTQVSRTNYHVRRLMSARVALKAICCNPEAEPIRSFVASDGTASDIRSGGVLSGRRGDVILDHIALSLEQLSILT